MSLETIPSCGINDGAYEAPQEPFIPKAPTRDNLSGRLIMPARPSPYRPAKALEEEVLKTSENPYKPTRTPQLPRAVGL